MPVRTWVTLLVVLIIGVLIGSLSQESQDTALAEDAAPSSTESAAEPTEEPTPEPTPLVVLATPAIQVVEMEVTPESCREAILAADAVIANSATFVMDMLDAYLDYPDENLAQFGARVEQLMVDYDIDAADADWTTYEDASDECLSR